MKTFRTILLIAGILVAGLALNTSFAQTISKPDKREASAKHELKTEMKTNPKVKTKSLKQEKKVQRKQELKSQKAIHKNVQKVKMKEDKRKLKE